MPLGKVLEITGEVPEILDKSKPVCLAMVFSFDRTNRSVVMYPCRDFELLNFVCIVPDSSLKNPATESWTASGNRDELVSLFNDYPCWVMQFLR